MIVMGESEKLFGFITILYALLSVLSLDSLLLLPDVHCLCPLEVRPSVSRGFVNFPTDYFACYYIHVFDTLRFRGTWSYARLITALWILIVLYCSEFASPAVRIAPIRRCGVLIEPFIRIGTVTIVPLIFPLGRIAEVFPRVNNVRSVRTYSRNKLKTSHGSA
jgi:hypothetical protein